jgi:uncharacterized repeat protein (TIGR01451 family)
MRIPHKARRLPVRRGSESRRFRAAIEQFEPRLLLSGFSVNITELDPVTLLPVGNAITVQDNNTVASSGLGVDSNPLIGHIQYDTPSSSPFTDFSISNLQATSNSTTALTVGDVKQSGAVTLLPSATGPRTLQITVTDTGFVEPTNLATLNNSSSVTFTNPNSLDKSLFQSFVTTGAGTSNSPVITLTPAAWIANNAHNPDSENGNVLNYPLGLLAPYTLTNTYTITLLPSASGQAVSATFQDTGITAVSGTNNAQLAGTVFNDLNHDLLPDLAGEAGIAGVTVTLSGHDASGNSISATKTTDSNGNYLFGSLPPSDANGYSVTEQNPVIGYFHEGQLPGSTGGTTADHTITTVLGGDVSSVNNNFAEELPAQISGVVFADSNHDLVQQSGEFSLANVTVTLSGTDDAGNAVTATTSTNGSGAYSFTGLRPSNAAGYTVTESQPSGFFHEGQVPGTTGGTTGDHTINTFLGANANSTANNFAEELPSALSGVVFADLNHNLVQDGSETGIANDTLTLSGTDDTGSSVLVTATTNAIGQYSFTGLRPSNAAGYTVTESEPATYVHEGQVVGSTGGTTGDHTINTILGAGVTSIANDFAEEQSAQISGVVFADLNHNLVEDGGETGITGVTVTLSGTDDAGGVVSSTTTTTSTGAYSFTGLRPSNAAGYTVTESQPATYFHEGQVFGSTGGSTGDHSITTYLGVNANSTANNFAEEQPAQISGVVFADLNHDLLQEGGEQGLSTVQVTLSGTDDAGNAVSQTTFTNSLGAYSFSGLRPSNGAGYTVTESQPSGFFHEGQVVGSTGGSTGDHTINTFLGANANSTANNFAEEQPAAISGVVFVDSNNDLVPQSGEPLLAGVTVSISGTDDAGNVISVPALTTNASGAYSFTGLRPSNAQGYTVTETQPVGYGHEGQLPGSTGGSTGDHTITTVLPANSFSINNNFAELLTDLAITKTDGTLTYVPGTTTTYTIVVSNNGPSEVFGAPVQDLVPAAITGDTWTAVASAGANVAVSSGSGNISTTVDLIPGATVTFTIVASISSTATGNLVNTATVASPAGIPDSNLANNTATDTDTPAPQVDLAITKTDGTLTYVPGTSTTYTIVVSNNGPSAVTAAPVADTMPSAITSDTWTAVASAGASVAASSGSGNIGTTVSLVPGATVTFTVVAQISASATGNLTNTATVATPAGVTDTNPSNNSATDTDTPTPRVDLAITKTDGTLTYVPGTSTTYTIVVSNNGPSAVTAAPVADTMPSAITSDTWTAVASAGASVATSSGSGSIGTTVSLVPGATVTFTVVAQISASATGNLTNTATVATPAGVTDTNTSNNSATDTDTPTPRVDLAITKTDGTLTYVPGTSTTYTIVVSNSGPSAVTAAPVADTMPSAITSDTWTAVASAGANVAANSGSGSIGTTVSLVPGATVTFTVVAQISASATGNLTNTATVATPAGVTDSNPNNNSATDTDTPTSTATIRGTKFLDLTGNGFSSDDTGLGGVVIDLENSTGHVLASTTTAANGTYSFSNVSPGTYKIAEVVPSGYVQTGPTSLVSGVTVSNGVATYTVTIGCATQQVSNVNFDDFQLLNCSNDVSNVCYTVVTPSGSSYNITSLNDNVAEGDTVTVHFTLNGPGSETMTLVSYTAPSGNFSDLQGQQIYSVDTETLAPGSHTLTVTIPNSYYQIDFVCGQAIDHFGPSGSNVFYHAEQRFHDSDQGGCEAPPSNGFDNLSGTVFVDNKNSLIFQSGDVGLAGVRLTLTGTDINGIAQNVVVTTGANGTYSFPGLQPSNSAGYRIAISQPSGYLLEGEVAGSTGGTTGLGTITTVLGSAANSTGNNFAELLNGGCVTDGDTATIGFWHNQNGQCLIRSFNGGSSATSLGNWLATQFPNLYSSLAGDTNSQVASTFLTLFNQTGPKTAAQVLGTALAVYASNSTLAGGNMAASCGFNVSATGVTDNATYNVGSQLSQWGGPQGTVTIIQLLDFVNAQSSNGNLANGRSSLLSAINTIFSNINQAGDING